ncbi:3-ketodihydrosphingosine reductase domain protein [Dictyocaulus viviparus]|uniref:3-ketodihydrosphingosine reductase domain protein n=1 Tax=Dictyocaulus viviparus TaxID=29172 RepID=A0A0D8XP08_DICVI|nr:3-ketodihydrosphingosine reductase domain protein [Dictyocaulus viviparus]
MVYATRCVVNEMKSRRSGHISFVSSAAGQCSLWGYTAYSPTKFAIRGFADAIQMELLPFNVSVSVLYPPNTDTEGFKMELRTMPEEVRLITETAGTFTSEEVANAHVKDIECGHYATTIGLEGWMLSILTAGGSPERCMFRVLSQVVLAGMFRGVILVYLGYFNRVVKNCHDRKIVGEQLIKSEEMFSYYS